MPEVLERLNETLAGRYRLERQLARGGAAIVFVAHDLRHDRQVALKVLRPDIAAALGAERFLREIKIAANLSHPHILPVYDSGEAAGYLFYVMPLVEGESLRERLAREHVLSVTETVKLLHDIADALHHAHERGVVHRDIKPDNVMLSGRHAMVTDFGVAKGLSEATVTGEVDTLGVALGTPAYMAPEQAAADPSIDHRADIYSLGALSYEMLTGRTPFRGASPQAILAAHVTEDPVPVADERVGVPDELASVVMRCLEKDPADRWQSAEEFLQQLGPETTPSGGVDPVPTIPAITPLALLKRRSAVITAAVAVVAVLALGWLFSGGDQVQSARPVLVVLPFENLGPSEDEYFANGVTDAITARLATLGGLGVISRTTAIQYQDSDKNSRQIANEVGADYVLEGTIQRERPRDPSSKVRITPQLIRASDDTHLWADSYDEDVAEVFEVQTQIAERVARAMDLTLLEPDRRSWSSRPTDNWEAYDYYLRGHDYLVGNRGSGDANARRIAVEMLDQAVALDSSFALAYADLSLAHIWLFRHYIDPSEERLALAKAALDRTLAIDPDLPAGHMALGHYYYWGSTPNRELALAEFKLVALREPNNAYARSLIGELQAAHGEWAQALVNTALAADLDPREPEWSANAGRLFLMARQYEEAERYLNRSLALAPDYADAHMAKIALYLRWQGDLVSARQAVDEMASRVTPGQVALALIEFAPMLVVGGDYDTLFTQLSPASISGPYPFDYYFVQAEFYRLRNKPAVARAYYDSLVTALESVPPERTDDPIVGLLLGLGYAGLGERNRAMERASNIETMISGSDDVLFADMMQRALVWIYALIGEYDAAVDHLQQLLATPSLVSTPFLQIEQFPGNLRRHPRFQQLLTGALAPPLS
ncbi:MAG: protein kinase [Gemmatimonadota bacterium]|nr:MAG: protein kinase [Gemmatimonadota bacterium]